MIVYDVSITYLIKTTTIPLTNLCINNVVIVKLGLRSNVTLYVIYGNM